MDFADILVVIFAIIGTIISAVAKSAKKKAAARQDTQPSSGSWVEVEEEYEQPEYWQMVSEQGRESYKTEATSQRGRELYTLETPSRQHWSYDQQSIAKAESSQQIDDAHRPKRDKHEVNDDIYSLHDEKTERKSHDALVNINLKDAIIYSELLKPKFQEY